VDARAILGRGVSGGLRLGRGTADRVVTLAGPPLGRLTNLMVSKVRRSATSTPTTFTPSKHGRAAAGGAQAPSTAPPTATPSPAVVARNIGPARPTATPARTTKPKGGPGAKLPPPRPSTS
jgi:hypothetical protein